VAICKAGEGEKLGDHGEQHLVELMEAVFVWSSCKLVLVLVVVWAKMSLFICRCRLSAPPHTWPRTHFQSIAIHLMTDDLSNIITSCSIVFTQPTFSSSIIAISPLMCIAPPQQQQLLTSLHLLIHDLHTIVNLPKSSILVQANKPLCNTRYKPPSATSRI
jgi:hypothetical protein